jgi:hypothetical protein
MADFESEIARKMFNNTSEKTFIDKVLSKEDGERIRDLIKKPRLNRSEILEILYLLGSQESKLLNYGENDRYVILKFFVWIREFVKITELLFDFQDDLYVKDCTCQICNLRFKDIPEGYKLKKCECIMSLPCETITPRARKLLLNVERHIEHITKFLVDLYLTICRTTMSLGATAFMELTRNKYELQYRGDISQRPLEEKKGWLDKMAGR